MTGQSYAIQRGYGRRKKPVVTAKNMTRNYLKRHESDSENGPRHISDIALNFIKPL